jgi:hypothetical protein
LAKKEEHDGRKWVKTATNKIDGCKC